MKAWYATATTTEYCTIVFAETRGKAKEIAMRTDACEDADFTDIRVGRYPQADRLYRGICEVDWYDPRDRVPLVKDLGWSCFDAETWECENCSARDYCERWKEQ